MSLLTLPLEILLEIASVLGVKSINSLVLSCRYLNHHLTQTLYLLPMRGFTTACRYGPGALLSAAAQRDTYTVEKMLKWGMVELFEVWDNRDVERRLFGGEEASALETLLACGMDPVTPFLESPAPLLNRAAAAGNVLAVKALLASLGKARIPSPCGAYHKPALICAVQKGFVDVAEILCGDKRVNVNVVDRVRGISVLHLAVQIGSQEVVRCLLRRNDINVDARCLSGETPLCWAARRGDLAMVRQLLEEGGAGVNLSGGSAQYPDPSRFPKDEVISLSRTPLHFAAISGHLSVVRFLADWEGVNINAQDAEGYTPLDHAIGRRHGKIVRVLKNHGAISKRYWKRRHLWRHAMALWGLGCFSQNE